MIPTAPPGISTAVIILAASILFVGLLSAGLGGRAAAVRGWALLGVLTGLGLALWGGLVVGMAELHIGWGKPFRFTAVLEALAYLIPVTTGWWLLRRAPRLRAALGHRSGLWRLASLQIARNVGVVFLILHHRNQLPGQFAYPAAWGDIAAGVMAPVAMWAAWFREDEVCRRGSGWQRAWIGFNVFGLLDHITAVTLGTLSFPGVTQIFDGPPDTGMFCYLPMGLFPLFLVPFACVLHTIMLDVVRNPDAVKARGDEPRRGRHDGAPLVAGGRS